MSYLLYTETYPSSDPAAARQTGIGRYCADLAAGLAELGESVRVLTNGETGAADRTEGDLRVQAVGPAPVGVAASLARLGLLRRVIRGTRPDHFLVGDPLAHRVVALGGSRVGTPYRPIFYGSELLVMEGLLAGPASFRRLPARHLTRRYFRRAAEAVCISRYTASLLRRVAPELRADCIVYPSVSDLVLSRECDPAFGPRLRERLAGPADPRPLVLLTVARISDRKNQLAVLRAVARVHETTPHRYHYLVLGNVDAEEHRGYFESLQSFIRSNGLEGWVSFVANATDEEKVDYLDACDVFAMLSRTAGTSVEGFGISAIEASCRGKPVLVSDEGGMPETILPGETGLAVPPDDIAAIARVLADWAADPALRARLGAAGRRFCRAEFTPVASARRLHEHLRWQPAAESRVRGR